MLKLTPSDVLKKIKSAPKLFITAALAVFFCILLVVVLAMQHQAVPTAIDIRGEKLNLLISKTDEEKERGLCCRDFLNKDQAMLFIYDEPGYYRFWMKDTQIPLDMIWISEDKKIIHLEKSVSPASFPTRFGPPRPAVYILETNAGWAQENNIQIGDAVSF